MTQLKDISLTSDKDYLKIWQDGQILISANGTPGPYSTFPSDPSAPFGFASNYDIFTPFPNPMVRAFWDPDKNGMWYNAESYPASGFFARKDPWLKVLTGLLGVTLVMNTDGAAKTNIPVFYRIYDLGNNAVDSDARIDKIFLRDSSVGVCAASPSSFDFVETILTIPHNGGAAPLWSVQFSEDQRNWYSEGTRIVGPYDTGSGPPGGPYSRYYYTTAFTRADANYLYIHLQSNYGSPKTIYVRYECDYRD